MRSAAIVAGTQELLRGELATRLSPGALDGRMMCTKNGVSGNFRSSHRSAGALYRKGDFTGIPGQPPAHYKVVGSPVGSANSNVFPSGSATTISRRPHDCT